MSAGGLYVGLMSGTSMDGIDAALAEMTPAGLPRLLGALTHPMPASLRATLHGLAGGQAVTLEALIRSDAALGELFAEAVMSLLDRSGTTPTQVTAIGSHGQTLWHSPEGAHPGSLQIGDANIIAERTGITTVADFRRRDMAAGGQGAPLVPTFHHAAFASPDEHRAVVNLGGIANITVLPRGAPRAALGFDSGPANTLLDAWTRRHLGADCDHDARWAASGSVYAPLLRTMLAEPYFARPPPKSTGRELFNEAWLDDCVTRSGSNASAADVQRTLVHLTGVTLRDALHSAQFAPDRVLLCGGGAHNPLLCAELAELLRCPVDSVERFGYSADYLEAIAFAWFARRRLLGLHANAPELTGAQRAVVLGAVYPGNPPGPGT